MGQSYTVVFIVKICGISRFVKMQCYANNTKTAHFEFQLFKVETLGIKCFVKMDNYIKGETSEVDSTVPFPEDLIQSAPIMKIKEGTKLRNITGYVQKAFMVKKKN